MCCLDNAGMNAIGCGRIHDCVAEREAVLRAWQANRNKTFQELGLHVEGRWDRLKVTPIQKPDEAALLSTIRETIETEALRQVPLKDRDEDRFEFCGLEVFHDPLVPMSATIELDDLAAAILQKLRESGAV